MNKKYRELFGCAISFSKEKINYLDFGMMPLVNNLNETREESLNCEKYPLVVNYYPKSKLLMLSVAINPNVLFGHYLYKSGTSKPYIEHCKEMYQYILKFVNVRVEDVFVDIGGNDGTLLKTFTESSKVKINPINIDPSENLGEISRKSGIETITKMWNGTVGRSSKFYRKCKVITSTNVFQHTENIISFVTWHS